MPEQYFAEAIPAAGCSGTNYGWPEGGKVPHEPQIKKNTDGDSCYSAGFNRAGSTGVYVLDER